MEARRSSPDDRSSRSFWEPHDPRKVIRILDLTILKGSAGVRSEDKMMLALRLPIMPGRAGLG